MTTESEIARLMAWLDSDQRMTPEQEAEATESKQDCDDER